jgi:amino acid adenylation domain-containing protein
MQTGASIVDPASAGSSGLPIHGLFEEHARRAPGALAVVFEDQQLSYGELDRQANQMARYLRSQGVGPNVLVAISVSRTPAMLVGLLGILKAGGAYVPLDPAYPERRLRYMLDHSKAAVLITDKSVALDYSGFEGKRICLDRDSSRIEAEADVSLDESFDSVNLAYVIYTSGSTGQPKGVSIPHAAVVNLFRSMKEAPGMTADDRVLAVTTLSFDISVAELFLPLSVGACVCLVGRRMALDALLLSKAISDMRITYLQATPPTWRMLLEIGWSGHGGLRITCGGETLTRDLAEELLPCCKELWNLYGPTEATVWATAHRVTSGEGPVPIGFPVLNTEVLVLDENRSQVPDGQPGELYIGGAGLAKGYLHDNEKTAAAFIPHPFSAAAAARLYRTGDLGYIGEGGILFHLGRTDQQVKVRGFRIELGEVEGALEALPDIRQAAVVAHDYTDDDRRLVAYLRLASGISLDRKKMRAALHEMLPEYMIPSVFIPVETFLLTPSGKIDRKSLPAPESATGEVAEDPVLPDSRLEEEVASIVQEILSLETVSMTDDLFHHGLHSLGVARIVARLRVREGVELAQRDIFEQSTIAGIVDLVEKALAAPGTQPLAPIEPVPREGHLPLTFAQQRVWILHQLYPESLAYNFQCTIRLKGQLQVSALERALNSIIRRHEIYRTTYAFKGEYPTQVIHPHHDLELPLVDYSDLPEGESVQESEELLNQLFAKRYDPEHLPMARWVLLKFNAEDHMLVHMEHHLVHDGWSFNLFLRELFAFYSAHDRGQPDPFAPLPVQFADFAAWERSHMQGPEAERQLRYWKEQLSGMPPLFDLSDGKPRPSGQSFAGQAPRFRIAQSTCIGLRALARAHRATMFMTMLTGFIALLHRVSQRTDIPVGTVFANRRHAASEDLIGMILNNVVIRASLAENSTYKQLLEQVKLLVMEASANQEVPFEQVVEALDLPRSAAYNPLFQVFFGFHDEPMPEQGPPALDIEVNPVISNGSAKFDLNIIVIPDSARKVGLAPGSDEDGLTLIWEYRTDLFDSGFIEKLAESYAAVLEELVNQPEGPVSGKADLPDDAPDGTRSLEAPKNENITTLPRNAVEEQLLEIWREVLAVDQIDTGDDFFDLGGHSLHALRVVARVRRRLGYPLTVMELFNNSTIAGVASLITGG